MCSENFASAMLRLPSSPLMASVLGSARRWLSGGPAKPLTFRDVNFETVPASEILEEEAHDASKGRYYPVRIGEVLNTKYQVVGKLGFGLGSTVWLAKNLQSVITLSPRSYLMFQ